MWILQATKSGGVRPLRFRLPAGAIKTIGRAPRADFIIDSAMVSRLHCRLTAPVEKGEKGEKGEKDGKEIEIQDLGSTNGTWVNGKRVRRGTLASGDRLKIGRVELLVSRQNQNT